MMATEKIKNLIIKNWLEEIMDEDTFFNLRESICGHLTNKEFMDVLEIESLANLENLKADMLEVLSDDLSFLIAEILKIIIKKRLTDTK
jgi:hypothetical protein